MKYLFYTLVLLFVISTGVSGQIPAQSIPDFQFLGADKKTFTTNELPKDKMIFFVFFDSECDHCQHAIKNIDKNYQAFQKTATYIISIDDHEKINQFMNTYGPHLKTQKNVVFLQDKFNQFITKFTPRKYPSMFLYSTQNKLLDYEDNEESIFRFLNIINKPGK
jgi:thiol-disulfide isomerase/thioredoxin